MWRAPATKEMTSLGLSRDQRLSANKPVKWLTGVNFVWMCLPVFSCSVYFQHL